MPAISPASPPEASRALGLSTVAFTICFAVWTIFSIIGLQIRNEFVEISRQFLQRRIRIKR